MVAPAVSKPVVRTTAPQRTWMPVRHFPVRKAEANLWFVDEDAAHVGHDRRMTIARRADGRPILHTPICLNEAAMREVSAFGEPAWLVVPEASVASDAAAWLARYPRCKVACPVNEAGKVSALCRIDGAL
jgi:hypothetical protein